jgi:membrane-associated phospholipid phosphatase
LLQIVIPSGFVLLKLKNNQISAWDLPEREERYPFLVVSIVSYLVSLVLIYLFGNAFLLNLSAISLLLLVLIAITTWFWKISLHSSLNTAGALMLNFLFDWRLPWLFLAIPLIIWARLVLKRHTPAQLLGGVGLSAAVVWLFLKYLHYI